MYNLRQIYPWAKIIGEEDVLGTYDTGKPFIMPDEIDK